MFFLKYKDIIDERVKQLCDSTTKSHVPWSEDVGERLKNFTLRGKTVRGSLLLFTQELFAGDVTDEAIGVAAALEFLHTALLIHDDLIDHDQLRRGKPSIHAQYETLGQKYQIVDRKAFGEGMAICVGDIAIFGAFSHIASLPFKPLIHQELLKTVTEEFLVVGFGELHDIALGYIPQLPPASEVLSMYRRKTARYTFSLPFILGCIVTEQSVEVRRKLERLGEYLGLMFQLKDDLLTLVGDEQEVGKTVGNDLAENKKTFALVQLWEKASEEEKAFLQHLIKQASHSATDINKVVSLMKERNIPADIESQIEIFSKKASNEIEGLDISKNGKEQFAQILRFLQERKK